MNMRGGTFLKVRGHKCTSKNSWFEWAAMASQSRRFTSYQRHYLYTISRSKCHLYTISRSKWRHYLYTIWRSKFHYFRQNYTTVKTYRWTTCN